MPNKDEFWMKAALRQAAKARLADEPPIGAVVVLDGHIIGRGFNLRETRQDATLHAEMAAIRQASRKLASWRLAGCTLYVTLEPCLMCAGAIIQARFDRVVFGAADPKAGACGSVIDAFAIRFNHLVSVQGGVLADTCSAMLKSYFQERRQLDKAAGTRAVRRAQALRCMRERQGGGDAPADG